MKSLSFVLLVSLAACGGGASSTGIEPLSCPTGGSTLTYASFGQAFVQTNCLACHETRENPRLTTQAAIQAHAMQILDEAVYTDAMPEDRDLAIEERRRLGEWLVCGAP